MRLMNFLRISLLIICLISIGKTVAQPSEATNIKERVTVEGIDFKMFSRALKIVQNLYVEELSEEELLEYAVKGMLSSLDPHSGYLDTTATKELNVKTTGKFGGLGIQVTMQDGLVKVISPIDDTPAFHAGIKSQDLIIKLDDTPVKGLSLIEAIDIMRGKPGTAISLTIIRDDKVSVIPVVRDIIKIQSAKSAALLPDYLYLRISFFAENTADEVAQIIDDRLKLQPSLKGILLDLRNNPGGLLSAAVDIANLFINQGVIVYTKGRVKKDSIYYRAKEDTIADNIPVVVMINAGSASASEIVAGALQDNKRALIVGKTSFGKGTVQRVLPLDTDNMIKFTTSMYYTPSGRSIQASGIIPDIILDNMLINNDANKLTYVTEKDLKNHIDAGQDTQDDVVENTAEIDQNQQYINNLKQDSQVIQALNILKAVSIAD